MELRSRDKKLDKIEYEELKLTLSGLGYYEDNMPLCEMREVVQALQLSDASSDMEKSMKANEQENEPGFSQSGNVFSSTMIAASPRGKVGSPPATPEPHFEIITVQAIVHHAYEWSPPKYDDNPEASTSQRKRKAEDTATIKRLRLNIIENAPDSGVNFTTTPESEYEPAPEPEPEPESESNMSISPAPSLFQEAHSQEWSENDSVNISDYVSAQLDVDSSNSMELLPINLPNINDIPMNPDDQLDESEFMENLNIHE